ncbi:fimbrial biogenesis chaperone [Yersinia mollaretii]|uniref:fimbrial biogenesis chaperone n=1 Tax=Yersinia mollaretii TaxID=33060 RepID=UPI0011A3E9CD|nr:molecular chaperone [Yersinia mollaretii]
MSRFFPLFSLMLSLFASSFVAQAEGFGINATRLIYPQGVPSISVTVRNTLTATPYLVQAGVSRAQHQHEPAPFSVTPPLFRLEAGGTNQIRIVAHNVNAPNDRESIFYFHASAIPASTQPESGSQRAGVSGTVQFGVGNIIKLFYRPSGLASSSAAAQRDLQFSRVKEGIQVSNNSPYFVSFSSLKVGGQAIKLDTPAALMIAPFSNQTYPSSASKGTVQWQTINDEGGINVFNKTLS